MTLGEVQPPALVQGEALATADDARAQLASYAKLTVDWQTDRESYLDNFVPFLLDALSNLTEVAITVDSARALISTHHHLDIPHHVVKALLQRATRSGLLKNLGNGQWSPIHEVPRSDRSPIADATALARELSALSSELQRFAKSEFGIELTQEEAVREFQQFITVNYGAVMSTWGGAGTVEILTKPAPAYVATAAFVQFASSEKLELFEYIVNVAKGRMLFAALFVKSEAQASQKFSDTVLYFDTRIVFEALGYHGETAKAAARTLIEFARGYGARIAVFDKTVYEARGVLHAAHHAALAGRLWEWEPGSVGANFLNSDSPAQDIATAIGEFETDVATAGFEIAASPPFDDYRYVVDEDALEAELRGLAPNYSELAARHEVSVIAAIVRVRAGRARKALEQCRAVFVTSNRLVLALAKRVDDTRAEPWPVAMLDHDLASLLWVKEPSTSVQIAETTLATTCLRVLRPTPIRWQKYVEAFERRLKSGEVTSAEVLASRAMFEAAAVAAITAIETPRAEVEQQVELTVATARQQAIEEAKSQLSTETADLASQLRDQLAANAKLKRELDASIGVGSLKDALTRAATSRAQRVAQRWVRAGILSAIALLVIAVFVAFGWITAPKWFVAVSRVAAAAITVSGGVGTFKHWPQKARDAIASALKRRFLKSEDYAETAE